MAGSADLCCAVLWWVVLSCAVVMLNTVSRCWQRCRTGQSGGVYVHSELKYSLATPSPPLEWLLVCWHMLYCAVFRLRLLLLREMRVMGGHSCHF
jgi:hypothetical protein